MVREYTNKQKTGKESRIRRSKIIENKKKDFCEKVKEKVVWNVERNINKVWHKISNCVKNIAKEIVEESRSSMPENKEIW